LTLRDESALQALELQNRLSDMQQEAIYFRGCYDCVGYLKKAGILELSAAALA
jgi:hypothetical protein